MLVLHFSFFFTFLFSPLLPLFWFSPLLTVDRAGFPWPGDRLPCFSCTEYGVLVFERATHPSIVLPGGAGWAGDVCGNSFRAKGGACCCESSSAQKPLTDDSPVMLLCCLRLLQGVRAARSLPASFFRFLAARLLFLHLSTLSLATAWGECVDRTMRKHSASSHVCSLPRNNIRQLVANIRIMRLTAKDGTICSAIFFLTAS